MQNHLFRVDETPTFELVVSSWLGSFVPCPPARCGSRCGDAAQPSVIGFLKVGVSRRRDDTFFKKGPFGVDETILFEMWDSIDLDGK